MGCATQSYFPARLSLPSANDGLEHHPRAFRPRYRSEFCFTHAFPKAPRKLWERERNTIDDSKSSILKCTYCCNPTAKDASLPKSATVVTNSRPIAFHTSVRLNSSPLSHMEIEPVKSKGVWEALGKKDDLIKLTLGVLAMLVLPKALERLWGSQSDLIWLLTAFFVLVALAAIILGFLAYHKSLHSIRALTIHLEKSTAEFKILAERISSLERLPFNSQKLALRIFSNESLQNLEQSKTRENCSEIWIVTKQPKEDTEGSAWTPVIKNNIADGITYVYICPNNHSVSGGLQGLKDVFRGRLKQCRVRLLEPPEFDSLPYSEIVVYDPRNIGLALECLCEIDVPERGWWVKLSNQHRNVVLGRLKSLASNAEDLDKF